MQLVVHVKGNAAHEVKESLHTLREGNRRRGSRVHGLVGVTVPAWILEKSAEDFGAGLRQPQSEMCDRLDGWHGPAEADDLRQSVESARVLLVVPR
jgi:hypothetical protein